MRIAPAPCPDASGDRPASDGSPAFDPARVVSLGFLYLVRLGLRQPADPRIRDALRVSESMLAVDTPSGIAYRRHNGDAYGEYDDGRPYDGSGIGRAWPLLTGERGHYALQQGYDPLPYLEAMSRTTGPWGMIPEQIWDAPPIEARDLHPGRPTGSAMPLAWAHAEFLKLLVARDLGQPIESLRCVRDRYAGAAHATNAWLWRHQVPFDPLPQGNDLVIEASDAFVLRFGFDGWKDVQERPSLRMPFGRHGVRFVAGELEPHGRIDFSCRFTASGGWEGVDHAVRLARR